MTSGCLVALSIATYAPLGPGSRVQGMLLGLKPLAAVGRSPSSGSAALSVTVMEATVVCVDNSEWTRSGDYAPTRFQAQADAVNLLAGAKTQASRSA